jgi:putative transposase
LRERIEEIAAVKRRYGYRRVYLRLRREGWQVNRKRVYRLYRNAGLAVRRRKRKRIGFFERRPLGTKRAPPCGRGGGTTEG